MSQHYMLTGVNGFKVIVRKAMCSFYKRIMKSENDLIIVILSSAYFLHSSKMFGAWNKMLFNYGDAT